MCYGVCHDRVMKAYEAARKDVKEAEEKQVKVIETCEYTTTTATTATTTTTTTTTTTPPPPPSADYSDRPSQSPSYLSSPPPLGHRLSSEVQSLEAQLEQLQATLEEKRNELLTSSNDQSVLEMTLEARKSHLTPLLFRSLPLESLNLVAGYSNAHDELFLVNKLWYRVFAYSRRVPGDSKPSTPRPSETQPEEE